MTGMGMMLSALGIKIADEDLRKIEMLLPQLPQFFVDAAKHLSASHQQLVLLNANVVEMKTEIQKLKEEIEDGRPDNVDDTGNAANLGTTDSPGGRYVVPRKRRPN